MLRPALVANALESAWENKTKIYGSSWDIAKAFDSASKDMIRLSSPATWVVCFDIVLRALEMEGTDPFLTVDLAGHSTPVPDCSFVDDLMSLTSSLAGLQRKADMMAARLS